MKNPWMILPCWGFVNIMVVGICNALLKFEIFIEWHLAYWKLRKIAKQHGGVPPQLLKRLQEKAEAVQRDREREGRV
jgi:hypothetical protein